MPVPEFGKIERRGAGYDEPTVATGEDYEISITWNSASKQMKIISNVDDDVVSFGMLESAKQTIMNRKKPSGA